ncbi:hypothetical protein EDB81DRAFT_789341 [Dactylonectria macrodidyma]|uniref:Uncharacterized protein n=1 Tax=Dactylonectria macrodidyma TaxID=307937 RepID=A0A9P9F2U7_9HYPO|nr:hypothetical protein EDB81DRAFT_789341 [Dactylonectria macrodidyma]
MTKYAFVVSNGVPVPANEAIRSHAIKTALQLRSKTVAGGAPPDGAANSKRTSRCKNELRGRFRLKPTSMNSHSSSRKGKLETKMRHATFDGTEGAADDSRIVSVPIKISQNHFRSNYSSGVEWFGGNILDPFGTIPILSNPRIDTLLKHFLVFFDYRTTTVPSNKTWLSRAINDPLLMRVTLCMTAAFGTTRTSSFSMDLRKEGWKLKGEAIHDVNFILQNGQVTENVLAAIAHLGHVASLEGSSEEADIHLRGLQGLIALRGGIKSIKIYQVGRFINWVDLELATARGRRPLYPLNYGLDRVKLPRYITESCEYPNLSRLQSLGPGYQAVMAVIQLLRQRVMAAKCNMDPTLRDVRTLSLAAAYITLDRIEDIPATLEEQCLRALLLAAHLFVCAALKQDHRWPESLSRAMAQRLQRSLLAGPSYSATWASHLPELLWALFVGAVIKGEDPQDQGTWFVSQLEVVQELLQCSTRMEFEGYLHCMVWDESLGIEFLDDWWADAAPPGTMPLQSVCHE